MLKKISTILLLLTLTSCSLAPFSSNKSGKSYGPGKARFELGTANASYYMKFGYGISENMDFGFVTEFGGFTTSGLFTKYSFINNESGPSLAMELGYGSSETTSYYYGGLIGSLSFTENFELFINPRVVSVSSDETDIELDKTVGNVKVLAYDVNYLYVSAGFNIWFSDVAGLSIYTIYIKGSDLETTEDQTTAGTVLFRF
jgi:hypothetical protein